MRSLSARRFKGAASTVTTYIAAAFSVAFFVLLLRWINVYGFIRGGKHLASLIVQDATRVKAARDLVARQQWRLLELEQRYTQSECRRENATSNPAYAWITALGNDAVSLPAIVAGHSVRTFSCHRQMIALVSPLVSVSTRKALTAVGYSLIDVESLDCNWMDTQQGRVRRNLGLPGTFMRLYVWSYDWLRKIIYFDPDYLVLSQIDELFDLDVEFAASHCSRPGVLDLCFNAGLAVVRPNRTAFRDIMSFWRAKSSHGRCPNDQNLLWEYFYALKKWTPLPYAYNVRRRIYRPLKAYHFAGGYFHGKPWNMCPRPSRARATKFRGPIDEVTDIMLLWWKFVYEAIDTYGLHDWWAEHSLQNTCRTTF